MGAKKTLASKIKTTYFEGANNSTPFFALVMPSGVTRSIVLLNRSFKRTSPVYDKIGKQIESQSGQNLCREDFAVSAILRYKEAIKPGCTLVRKYFGQVFLKNLYRKELFHGEGNSEVVQ